MPIFKRRMGPYGGKRAFRRHERKQERRRRQAEEKEIRKTEKQIYVSEVSRLKRKKRFDAARAKAHRKVYGKPKKKKGVRRVTVKKKRTPKKRKKTSRKKKKDIWDDLI
jgi:hypothetical protein